MLFNYLKIAFRKHFSVGRGQSALYTWINVLGLTIGLTAALLIGHFVHYELGYDRIYPNHNRIYRMAVERRESGESTMNSAKTYAGIGKFLTTELEQVEQCVRMLYEECMFHYEEQDVRLNRQHTLWADGNFHEFFGLKMLIKGQLELLQQPNHAIISNSAAVRFFGRDWSGDNSPIGKTLLLNGGVPFMIQGVFEDVSEHTHMQFDFVVSYSTLMALLGDYMNTVMPPASNFVYNYVSVREGVEPGRLEPLINDVIADHTGQVDDHVHYDFSLQPITSIHLDSHLSDELSPNGNRLFVTGLSAAALLIIIVAWINFINLTIARALNRSREVGVRKAIGARKRQLATQFATETFFAGMLAFLITMALAFIGGPLFNRITDIPLSLYSPENWRLWLIFAVVFITGALLASVYPALVLSSFDTIKALKGKSIVKANTGIFRRGLIVFQFSTAMLLIAGTGAVYYQVESMRSESLGANLNQVLVIHSPRTMIGNPERALYFKRFRDLLEPNTDVLSVASGGCLPGEKFLFHTEHVQVEGKETDISWSFDLASVDEHYIPALGMRLIAGRNFEELPNEETKVIINETALEALGFEDAGEAVGQFVRINHDEPKQIIGILKDVHFEGLKNTVKPLVLTFGHDYEFGFFPIKIRTPDIRSLVKKIEWQWGEVYTRDPFDYFFLDTFFDRQYRNEKAFGQLFGSFALLTVLIAGLGLFGLISLITYQKSKEIGIRKVFGASVPAIIRLLAMDFLKLVLISAIISLPLAYWIIDQWLSTFAYRFDPSIWIYALPLVLLLVTSFVAMGGQTIKSALKNPVDAIADE